MTITSQAETKFWINVLAAGITAMINRKTRLPIRRMRVRDVDVLL
jgi:hypothetical protein